MKAREVNLMIGALTDSSLLQDACKKQNARLRIRAMSTGHYFMLVGEDGRALTPLFSSGRGLLEHLYILNEEPLADIREVL